ncbi:hypothetical protein M0805_000182 [Coniferiporia weirii]|nr:hypothetical protein M0805_000182 [Coniferiporia weirii]
MSGVSKIVIERNQRILLDLVSQTGNDVCADCKSKAPRWASHNLGIFICVRCASIHRKIGTHVTKVKSLTLDSWSKEQVENMKVIGNVTANAYWNPDEVRHPLPTNMEESERDSELEKYIRSKYEYKRFRPLSARAAEQLGASQSKAHLPVRSHTAPIRSGTSPSPGSSHSSQPPLPNLPSSSTTYMTTSNLPAPAIQARSASTDFSKPSRAIPKQEQLQTQPSTPALRTSSVIPFSQMSAAPPNQQASLTSSTFNDLLSLQDLSTNSSLPLQYQGSSFSVPNQSMSSASPHTPFPSSVGTAASPDGTTSYYANMPAIAGAPGAPSSTYNQTSNLQSLPAFGQTANVPFGSGMSPPGVHTTIPSNPFEQRYTGMSTTTPMLSQSPVPNFLSPQTLQLGTTRESQTLPFRQNSMPFMPQHSVYQTQQQPAQPMQANANFQRGSPYAQQAQQAQQLFQNMAGRSNPFGAQWNGAA